VAVGVGGVSGSHPHLPGADRVKRLLRILVVHNRYRSDTPSGENDVVDSEVAALRALGHDVMTHFRSSDEIDQMSRAGRATLPLRSVHSRADVATLRQRIRDLRPDVMHVHNLNPLISPAAITTAKSEGVPVVMTVHNFRLACLNGTFFRDGHECTTCLGRRVAIAGVRHGCYRGSHAQSAALATVLAAHRGTYQRVDRFLALSPSVADFLHDLGVASHRVTLKPNTTPDPGPPQPPGRGFVFLGRLVPEKGARLLVEAWTRHSPGTLGTLSIAGDGPERGALEAMIAGRADVRMLGQLPPTEVADTIRDAAVVVVPSLWREAFPHVIVEALAHGRPVLATDEGSLSEIVGDAGWVAAPTTDALTAVLRAAAAADLDDYSARARRRYEECYSPRAVHDLLVATYYSVCA
jgi:glycosyltransferase involved in cell wall biosynthesis